MSGRFQDTALPDAATRTDPSRREPSSTSIDTLTVDDLTAQSLDDTQRVVELIEELNADQAGRTWCLPAPPASRSIPAWTSRAAWQSVVRRRLNSRAGRRAVAKRYSDTEHVFAAAVMQASVADHRTGRHVTAGRELLARRAGLTLSQFDRARWVLADLGLAVEVARGRLLSTVERVLALHHHGQHQRRATSHWILTMQVTKALRRSRRGRRRFPQPCDQPPLGGRSLSSSVGKNSPKARPLTRTPGEDRTLEAHKLVAGLLTRIPAIAAHYRPAQLGPRAGHLLDRRRWRHVGELVDVVQEFRLVDRGLDAGAVQQLLEVDTAARGWNWPESINQPVAFLRTRLKMLDLHKQCGEEEKEGSK